MRYLIHLAMAGLIVAPAALSAQSPFEGVVTLQMTVPGGQSMEPVVYVKGTRTRMEFNTGGQQGYMVMDLEQGKTMMVMPTMRMFMLMDMSAAAEEAKAAAGAKGVTPSDVKVEATGRKETIIGIECEHYIVSSGKAVTDMCLAKGMGTFMGVAGGAGPGGRGAAPALGQEVPRVWRQFKDGAFLLKADMKEGEETRSTLLVTKIEKKAVSDELFALPEGFRDMSGMMQNMPGRRPPGGR